MCLRMDLFELSDRYLGVDLSGGKISMPQHLLDKADIGAMLQHQGRHSMAEQVT